jgi:hypothetical protein
MGNNYSNQVEQDAANRSTPIVQFRSILERTLKERFVLGRLIAQDSRTGSRTGGTNWGHGLGARTGARIGHRVQRVVVELFSTRGCSRYYQK